MWLRQAIDAVPDSLCRDGTANTEMRAKFEKMCREAQDQICEQLHRTRAKPARVVGSC